MLNTFLFRHPPIQFEPGHEDIRDQFYRIELDLVCRVTLGVCWDERLEKTRIVRIFVNVFELAVEEMIEGLDAQSYNERVLLETVALHRIQQALVLEGRKDDQWYRGVVVLGTMIQHRLAILLSNVRPPDARRIYDISKLPGINDQEWRDDFVGAAAVAKIIRLTRHIPGAQVFLPTAYEDIHLAIDLFLLRGQTLLALSIKAGMFGFATWAELVLAEQRLQDRSRYGKQCRAVLRGVNQLAQELASTTTYDIHAVMLHVGQENGSRTDILVTEADAPPLLAIFREVEERKHEPVVEPVSRERTDVA